MFSRFSFFISFSTRKDGCLPRHNASRFLTHVRGSPSFSHRCLCTLRRLIFLSLYDKSLYKTCQFGAQISAFCQVNRPCSVYVTDSGDFSINDCAESDNTFLTVMFNYHLCVCRCIAGRSKCTCCWPSIRYNNQNLFWLWSLQQFLATIGNSCTVPISEMSFNANQPIFVIPVTGFKILEGINICGVVKACMPKNRISTAYSRKNSIAVSLAFSYFPSVSIDPDISTKTEKAVFGVPVGSFLRLKHLPSP